MIGKFVTKLIQSLPTWEVTKYYGRVCMYQLKCLKYKVQTSEAWFNFKCKFMPGSLQNEIECEECKQDKVKDKTKQQQPQQQQQQQPPPQKRQQPPQQQLKQQVKQKLSSDAEDYPNQKQLKYTKDKENEYIETSFDDVKDSFIPTKKQKHDNVQGREKGDYYMKDDYRAKKQRKV